MAYEPSKEAVQAALNAELDHLSAHRDDWCGSMRAALIAAHEAENFDAEAVFAKLKAIKQYALEQVPTLETIERELLKIRAEIGPVKSYADELGLRCGVMASAVHIKLDMIDRCARTGLAAIEAQRAKKE